MTKIMHLMGNDKFSAPYIEFIKENFNFGLHEFVFTCGFTRNELALPNYLNVIERRNKYQLLQMIPNLLSAKKIIIHALFDKRVVLLLVMMPWLLKKTSWVIWGGDLYCDVNRPMSSRSRKGQLFFRIKKFVCSRMHGFITYIDGDYELAKQIYGGNAKLEECIMYLSNVYIEDTEQIRKNYELTILVGNSATESNNHLEVFNKIQAEHLDNYKIWCPLNYGDKNYARQVVEYGKQLFRDKFEPILEFMPLDEYRQLLSSVDIAIFNHNRQQGMGNIVNLLGMGKVVYIRNDITTWSFLQRIGISVFNSAEDTLNINQALLDKNTDNIKIIKNYFSLDNLIAQSSVIFNG